MVVRTATVPIGLLRLEQSLEAPTGAQKVRFGSSIIGSGNCMVSKEWEMVPNLYLYNRGGPIFQVGIWERKAFFFSFSHIPWYIYLLHLYHARVCRRKNILQTIPRIISIQVADRGKPA